MNAVILYRIDTGKRMHRYYRMDVQPDLFGEWCLMRRMGPHRQHRADTLRPLPYPAGSEGRAR